MALVGAPAQAVSAPDPYSGTLDTQCSVDVPATIEPGDRVVVRVSVAANSPTPPTGKIDLTISTAGGDAVWNRTVRYSGGTERVVGPVLPKDDYRATARFRPSDSAFAGCRDSELFAVDDTDQSSPDDPGPDGLLPDTGGPALLWLLVGVGLVGGGAATVAHARRRTATAST